MNSRILLFLIASMVAFSASGCAEMFKNFRTDLDDAEMEEPPIAGGRWPEKGILGDDLGRSPASVGVGSNGAPSRSWITPDTRGADARASGEEGEEGSAPVAFSNTPTLEPPTKRLYKNGARATRSDFIDETPNEGSLWGSDGQTNYYFTKNKVRTVGDIVTLNVEGDLVRDIGLETRRTLTSKERENEYVAAQERLRMKALGLAPDDKAGGAAKDTVGSSAAAPDRNLASGAKKTALTGASGEEPDVPAPTLADIDVSKSMEVKAGDVMMGEIMERYPNGNYKIRATKRIPYKNGNSRLVTLVGVVKGSDISEDDVVASGKLYEYRIESIR